MAKIEIDDVEYEAETTGLNGIRTTAQEAGVALRKDFRGDDPFPKTDPRAKRGSAFEATRNTVEALAKAAKESVAREADLRKDLDEAVQAIALLKNDVRHLAKGETPCGACDALGKKDGKDCDKCGASGYVAPKPPTAKA